MSIAAVTYRELDDSIQEMIRAKVVSAGYFPDLRSFQPQSPANVAAFEAAKAAIISGGKELIDVIGNGIPKKKGEVLMHTIYINRTGNNKGSVSIFDEASIDTGGGNFQRVKTHGATQNVTYEVRFVADRMDYAQIIKAIIEDALGSDKDYYPIIDIETGIVDPERVMLLEFTGSDDVNYFDYKEYIFTFNVLDAWVVSSSNFPNGVQTITNPNIVPITEIEVTLDTEQDGNDDVTFGSITP